MTTTDDQKVFTAEQYESNSDFMYATAYAWGRSDQGAGHDSNDIFAFGAHWVEAKRAFRAGDVSHITSLMAHYDDFFKDKKKN